MAQKKQIALRKKALISQMAQSREDISQGRKILKEKLNFKKQVSSVLRHKPKAIFAGSAVVGLATTLILRRPRKSSKKTRKTLIQMTLGWILTLLKPTAKKWLKNSIKTYAIGQLSQLAQNRHGTLSEPKNRS